MNGKSHLEIYEDQSILVDNQGKNHIYKEGRPDDPAKKRLAHIKDSLEKGWLKKLILDTIESRIPEVNLKDEHTDLLGKLVDSITSEVGRAIVGLTVLQMTVKSIEPGQSIRLHKGGTGDFSWKDGIPMRSLDKSYVTPVLREFNLLLLNADGFMMTRSLAENYPYSGFYKAAIRGGKQEWVRIVDLIESGVLNPKEALVYVVSLLSNKSKDFQALADETISILDKFLKTDPSFEKIYKTIVGHFSSSTYSARLFEVAMHSLLQVADVEGALGGMLLPLCQMRSANKKHRNIADIEVVLAQGRGNVIEAWEAKYGKPYLRDELEELIDKLPSNPNTKIVGFVTDSTPDITKDIRERVEEIKGEFEISLDILSFNDWTTYYIDRIGADKKKIGKLWLRAYVESLCQKRRDRAPIDEPAGEWVKDLKAALLSSV